jgi:hypothetical protein
VVERRRDEGVDLVAVDLVAMFRFRIGPTITVLDGCQAAPSFSFAPLHRATPQCRES